MRALVFDYALAMAGRLEYGALPAAVARHGLSGPP